MGSMPVFEWNEEFAIGVPEVDAQHRRLVELLNRFEEAARRGRGQREVGATLAELIDYARTHFAVEEGLMEARSYPQLARHRAQHRRLLEKIARLRDRHEQGRCITVATRDLLRYWVVEHIMRVDRQIGAYLLDEAEDTITVPSA